MSFRPLSSFVIAVTLCTFTTASATAASDEVKTVTASTLVNASPSVVWEAIRGLRRKDSVHRKLVSYKDNEAVLEEKFLGLPIIGDAVCTYKESEVPFQRIDYRLIKSDHFKVFEGSWVLTPAENGQKTLVCLSSCSDPGLRVPFWKDLTKMATSRHIKKRLAEMKEDAESPPNISQSP